MRSWDCNIQLIKRRNKNIGAVFYDENQEAQVAKSSIQHVVEYVAAVDPRHTVYRDGDRRRSPPFG